MVPAGSEPSAGSVPVSPTHPLLLLSVHLQRRQQGDVCPAPRALLPARLLHRLRHRALLPLPGRLLWQWATVPARRYVGWATWKGCGARGWVANARVALCLHPGAVHRLNGKVSGSLVVGRTPVRFQDVDLHAYIVGSDGRAYTAISGVPAPAARALLPLLPLGGLFGWLFALEEPGSENGFSITGEQRWRMGAVVWGMSFSPLL